MISEFETTCIILEDMQMTDALLEQATLKKDESGVDTEIHFSSRGNAQHGGPRVKFPIEGTRIKKDNLFSITTSGQVVGSHRRKAHEIKKFQDWVKENKDNILKRWQNAIDDSEFRLNVKDSNGFYTNPNHPNYISPENR